MGSALDVQRSERMQLRGERRGLQRIRIRVTGLGIAKKGRRVEGGGGGEAERGFSHGGWMRW